MTTFFSNQQDSSINGGGGSHIRIQSGIWGPCQKQTLRQGFGFRRFVSEVIPEISVREWQTAQGAELLTAVFVGSRGNERLHRERLLYYLPAPSRREEKLFGLGGEILTISKTSGLIFRTFRPLYFRNCQSLYSITQSLKLSTFSPCFTCAHLVVYINEEKSGNKPF